MVASMADWMVEKLALKMVATSVVPWDRSLVAVKDMNSDYFLGR